MKIGLHGDVGEVTGSRHLLEAEGMKVLLDRGPFQGHRKEALAKNRDIPFDPAGVDALLLSHAHAGRVPRVRRRLRPRIIALRATGPRVILRS